MKGYVIIECPKGEILGAGWTHPSTNDMSIVVWLTFDAAKVKIGRLRRYSRHRGLRWAVVSLKDWCGLSPADLVPLYEELGR